MQHEGREDAPLGGGSALRAGMAAFGVREGWVVTLDEEEEIAVDEGVVHVVPA